MVSVRSFSLATNTAMITITSSSGWSCVPRYLGFAYERVLQFQLARESLTLGLELLRVPRKAQPLSILRSSSFQQGITEAAAEEAAHCYYGLFVIYTTHLFSKDDGAVSSLPNLPLGWCRLSHLVHFYFLFFFSSAESPLCAQNKSQRLTRSFFIAKA